MQSLLAQLEKLSYFFGKTFALWVLCMASLAYFFPQYFTFLVGYISILLGIVMFGMGLTLKIKDFALIIKRPKDVAIGIGAQFLIMPILAYVLCILLDLDKDVALGVILVGCCPGGTASNVMTYLAKGDVALSVTMSACTTLLAPIFTPFLIFIFANKWVDITISDMFLSIVNVVLVPIVLGVLCNALFRKKITPFVNVIPLVSVFSIVAIVAAVISVSQAKLGATALEVFAVVILHNLLGLLLGFVLAKALNMNLPKQKALSIEVGMQNSGLGVALAMAHFNPLSAVPSAIFSVWHNISGPILATFFANLKEDEDKRVESINDNLEFSQDTVLNVKEV